MKCAGCGSTGNVKRRCIHCKKVGYCSTTCYALNRIKHKAICGRYSSNNNGGEGEEEGYNKIKVVGTHTLRSDPDTFLLRFKIVTLDNKAENAGKKANQIYESVMTEGILKASSLEIEESSFSVFPNIIYPRKRDPYQMGFKGIYNLKISSSDPYKAGDILSLILKRGRERISINNLSFILRKDNKAVRKAIEEATKNAVEKIEIIARVSKADAWRIISVEEGGASTTTGRSLYESNNRNLELMDSEPQSSTTVDFIPHKITPAKVSTTAKVYVTATM